MTEQEQLDRIEDMLLARNGADEESTRQFKAIDKSLVDIDRKVDAVHVTLNGTVCTVNGLKETVYGRGDQPGLKGRTEVHGRAIKLLLWVGGVFASGVILTIVYKVLEN